jgi:molybdopterin/thiamine biosynthesis adenylyltransferase
MAARIIALPDMRKRGSVGLEFDSLPETRSSRQELIEWWDQERLASARVVVAGAGAVGNEALKLLALLGVGAIVVVDFDVVSITNLSRTVLFRPEDVGLPKASLAAERVRAINPEIHITAIDGDIGRDIGMGTLRDADVVLGCLDSVNARWILNRRCLLAGVPWINAGISASEGRWRLLRVHVLSGHEPPLQRTLFMHRPDATNA